MVIMKIPNVTAAGGDALTSFESNVIQTATAGGAGGGAGKAIPDPIKIVKPLSISSQLISFALTGRHIPSVEFDFHDKSGKTIYQIILTDAVVGKFSYLSADMTNEIWFSFGKIQYTDPINNKTTTFSPATGVVN